MQKTEGCLNGRRQVKEWRFYIQACTQITEPSTVLCWANTTVWCPCSHLSVPYIYPLPAKRKYSPSTVNKEKKSRQIWFFKYFFFIRLQFDDVQYSCYHPNKQTSVQTYNWTFTIINLGIVFVARYLCMFMTSTYKLNVVFDTTVDITKQLLLHFLFWYRCN